MIAYILASILVGVHFFHGPLANILILLVTAAVIVFYPAGMQARLLGHDWAYLLYFIFILFSAAWSISPRATFLQALPLVTPWLASLLLSQAPADWAARVLVRFALAAALLSPFVILLSYRLAFQPKSSTGAPELRGVFVHQQYLGAFMSLVLGIVAIAYLNGQASRVLGSTRFVRAALIVLFFAMVLLSRARIYPVWAVVCVALTFLLGSRGSRKWLALNGLIIVGFTLALTFGAITRFLDQVGFDTTLTGRTYIWDRALSGIRGDTEVLGFGFGTFELDRFDTMFGEYRPAHAHSSFIQAYFETGQVGLVLVIVLILTQFLAAWRYSVKSGRYSYSMFLVLYCAFSSVTGGVIYAGALVTLFCLMMLFLAIETHKTPASSSSDMENGLLPSGRAAS